MSGTKHDCWYKDVCTTECTEGCIRYKEMKFLMDNSNIPKKRQYPISLQAPREDADSYRQLAEIKSGIVDFVRDGNNLYITSSITGNGKTTWALKLMLKYFNDIWCGNGFRVRGVYVHIPTFLIKCKDFKNVDEEFEQLKANILTADLVIWDDIGSTVVSGYDFSQLIMYIDNRVLNCKSNIFTGNIETYEEMVKMIGHKLSSRVFSSNTKVIKFKGADKR